ncbi:MAG TPA: hypothetical protein VMJ70_02810 [Candidatus Sulfotelmatobacter sp.]|nr:hypothetical protein [Candidatus Sulfotelmatobacter sp.]
MNVGETPAGRVTEAATALSRALDRNDYATASGLIAPGCVYEVRGERVEGSAAIIASYAGSNQWAIEHLDEVRYESVVEAPHGDTAPVLYTDYLMKAGAGWHRHRCRQHLTVGAEGKIVRIVHEDLPGEVEALDEYFARCGIER